MSAAGVPVTRRRWIGALPGKISAKPAAPRESSEQLPVSPLVLACLGMSGLALILSLTALVLQIHHLRDDHASVREAVTPSVPLPSSDPVSYTKVNLEDMYSPRFHASLSETYDLNGTGIRPSAVFYGDIIVRSGTILYDDRAMDSTVASAPLPDEESSAIDNPPAAKDRCLGGICHCGMGFSAGPGHLVLASCHDCTEEIFLRDRGECCSQPSRCGALGNETCFKFGTLVSDSPVFIFYLKKCGFARELSNFPKMTHDATKIHRIKRNCAFKPAALR